MQIVIDTNRLNSSELTEFLQASKKNKVVLTDYAAMESLNTPTISDFLDKMSIVRKYPEQVIVLKNTQKICGLSGRASGLTRRMVDEKSSTGFAEYARRLKAAENGHAETIGELSAQKKDAKHQIDRMLEDAENIAPIFEHLAAGFDKDARKVIVSRKAFTVHMIEALIPSVMEVAANSFKYHPIKPRVPNLKELPNTFIFRNSLCCYLVALKRAANGSTKMKDVRLDKIRNDMIDTHFATYATYFDGFMTADEGASWLHQRTTEILYVAFGSA